MGLYTTTKSTQAGVWNVRLIQPAAWCPEDEHPPFPAYLCSEVPGGLRRKCVHPPEAHGTLHAEDDEALLCDLRCGYRQELRFLLAAGADQ